MVFKNLCILVLWKKVASALEGLISSVIADLRDGLMVKTEAIMFPAVVSTCRHLTTAICSTDH